MGAIGNIIEQGLLYGIMVLGVYITYRLLDFPDLSVDGTFPLGASITATAMAFGVNPWIATLLALIGGMLAGLITGLLHVKLKITNLLSGILVMTGIYSINLRIMGKANVALFQFETIFDGKIHPLIILSMLAIVIKIILDLFFKTRLGFLVNAVGDNPILVTSLGIDKGRIKCLGLMISNGLVALSGSAVAQHQGFSDVGMGGGIIVMGLASIIIGEMVFKKISLMAPTTMVLLGSILYKGSTALALRLKLPSTDLKLITSVIVVMILSVYGKGIALPWKKVEKRRGGSIVAHSKSI